MKDSLITLGLEALAFLVIFFAPLQGVIFAIGFLILVDSVTGIWAAKNRGEKIVSRKGGRVITKLILFPLAIVVAEVAKQFLAPAVPWTDVTAGIIATWEVKSIFENISSILGYNLWEKFREKMWKDKKETNNKDENLTEF